MNWIAIVSMIITLLQSLKKSESAEVFAASPAAVKLQDKYGLDGSFLRALWENREEILAFVLKLVDLFSENEDDREVIGQLLNDK